MIRNMRGLKGEEIENHNYIDQVNEAATYIFRLLFSSSLPSQSVTTQVELHSENLKTQKSSKKFYERASLI